jgi:hypothetical protein
MTSNDPKDQPYEVSNHSNVPSRTTEANESGLISQVLEQVKNYFIIFLFSLSASSPFYYLSTKT